MNLEFANARIKSLEKNMLTSDKIIRLIDAETLSDAVKILAESNYGDGLLTDGSDFDDLLLKEESKATNVFFELMPSGYGLETFIIKNDYHNAKAYYKSKVNGIKNKRALKPSGIYSNLEDCISKENYSSLSSYLSCALSALDKLSQRQILTGQQIDLVLDQAYFNEVAAIISKAKKSVVQDYYKILIDTTNIKTFARCKKMGMKIDEFERFFIPVLGDLTLDRIKLIYDLPFEEIKDKMKYSNWKRDFEIISQSFVSYETYVDNQLIKLTKNQKFEMFTPSPLIGYYLGKLTEIKVVRLVLTCKKNGISKEEIKIRVRETYA